MQMHVAMPNLKPDGNTMPDMSILDLPLIEGTPESLAGYGEVVSDPESQKIEIVRWPAQGWRPVDPNSGDEGGTTEGIFACQWVGDILKAQNHAVGGDYVLGWSCLPSEASEQSATLGRHRALMWRANYHPDGGQMFHPLVAVVFAALGLVWIVMDVRRHRGTHLVIRTERERIHFGEPMHFEGDADDDDSVIEEKVWGVRQTVQSMVNRGLRDRKHVFW